jgi:predicted dehydrogenase
MSYDFAVLLPELVGSFEDAERLHAGMCNEVNQPAAQKIQAFVDELNAAWGFARDDDDCILTAESDADARGTVVCTSWHSVEHNRRIMFGLTRDHGLLLFDPQQSRLYDPRGHIDVDVELGDGTRIPYVSPALLASLLERPDAKWPWLIIERAPEEYIQSRFDAGEPVVVEYRDGGPDRHFGTTTTDRNVVHKVLWEWVIQQPGWGDRLTWQRIEL